MSASEKAAWILGLFSLWTAATLMMVAMVQSWGGSLFLTLFVMVVAGAVTAEMLGKAISDK